MLNAPNKLPIELHIPGSQFYSPGTHLQKRLIKDDNPLDAACREHDIAYSRNKDLTKRHVTAIILAEEARKTDYRERFNSWRECCCHSCLGG